MRDGGELLMRYRYTRGDTVDALRAQPGTRFPHAWIGHGGERRSTLDLFGRDAVRIGGPAAPAGDALRAGIDFRFLDDGVDWRSLTEADDTALIEVRPDGFVAAQ